jgi:hypothetical protein
MTTFTGYTSRLGRVVEALNGKTVLPTTRTRARRDPAARTRWCDETARRATNLLHPNPLSARALASRSSTPHPVYSSF